MLDILKENTEKLRTLLEVVKNLPPVKIDTSDCTATPADILKGKTAWIKGAKIMGRCSYDANTSSADVTASDILKDKIAFAKGAKIIGSCTYDADTSGANATAEDIKEGCSAWVKGQLIEGAMVPESSKVNVTLAYTSSFTSWFDGVKTTHNMVGSTTKQVVKGSCAVFYSTAYRSSASSGSGYLYRYPHVTVNGVEIPYSQRTSMTTTSNYGTTAIYLFVVPLDSDVDITLSTSSTSTPSA